MWISQGLSLHYSILSSQEYLLIHYIDLPAFFLDFAALSCLFWEFNSGSILG